MPLGSILGPLLFNIFISNLFLILHNIESESYADDNKPYCFYECFKDVIICLEKTADDLFTWFSNNEMKANADKCHLLLSTKELKANILNYAVINSDKEKLLADNHLNFEPHIKNLRNKASQKLHALPRLSLYMSLNQRKIITQSFIMSQFGYCPLIWMNHSQNLNNNINGIHEKALRIVYRDKKSTFKDLFEKYNSVTILARNLQTQVKIFSNRKQIIVHLK